MTVVLWGLQSGGRRAFPACLSTSISAVCKEPASPCFVLITLKPSRLWTSETIHRVTSLQTFSCDLWLWESESYSRKDVKQRSPTLHWAPFILEHSSASFTHLTDTLTFSHWFFPLFTLNHMVHWTNTELDSHYTFLYSCHRTECNSAQCAQLMDTREFFMVVDMCRWLSTTNTLLRLYVRSSCPGSCQFFRTRPV